MMTDDIIERAEAFCASDHRVGKFVGCVPIIRDLLAELKVARAQRDEFRAQLEYEQRQQFGFGSMYSAGSDV